MTQYSCLLLVLLIVCLASSNSISAKVVDVDVICKEASNPSYCSNLLNSKPGGAKGVELIDLAEYIIVGLNDNVTDTYKIITELISGNNLTVVNYYYRCASVMVDIDSVTTRLLDAKLDVQLKHYQALAKDTSDAMQYLLECSDDLKKNKTSRILAKSVDELRQGVQIVQIITKYLNVGT